MAIRSHDNNELIRRLIQWAGVAGTAVFGLILTLAWLRPVAIEQLARAAISMEVQSQVAERLQALDDSSLVRSAERILARSDREIAEEKAALKYRLPSQVRVVIDNMLDPGCPCRQRLAGALRGMQNDHIGSLQQANAHITQLIESKYRGVAQSLLREVKIFSAANGMVFLLLTLTAMGWKRPALQLLAPALVMAGAAVITSGIYLFKQDWLHTLLFGDYVGLYYVPYLLATLGFLADVVFNRARCTMLLLGGMLTMLGAVAGAAVC